jgi:hypothetical protein
MPRHLLRWGLALVGIVGGFTVLGLLIGGLNPRGDAAPSGAELLPTEIPMIEIVRARQEIPAMAVITDAAMLEVISVPAVEYDPLPLTSMAQAQGAITRRRLRQGEILSMDSVFRVPAPVMPQRPLVPPDAEAQGTIALLRAVATGSLVVLALLVGEILRRQTSRAQ